MSSEWMIKQIQFLIQYEGFQTSAGTVNVIREEIEALHQFSRQKTQEHLETTALNTEFGWKT